MKDHCGECSAVAIYKEVHYFVEQTKQFYILVKLPICPVTV